MSLVVVLCETYILEAWLRSPDLPKRAYRWVSRWQSSEIENDLPLTAAEVEQHKATLRRLAPSTYARLFPEVVSDEPLIVHHGDCQGHRGSS
jgi:hypothetical protein